MHFVVNFILSTICEFYYDDVTIKYSDDVAGKSIL